MYSVTQCAKQIRVSAKTLQRWDREGRLKAKRTLSGRRYYDDADLARALHLPMREASRRTIAYCWLSSPAHQDRLARFGFALLKHLCETHQTDLEVMNAETLSPEHELKQDLMSIVHCFCSRVYGPRNDRKALEKALRYENRA